MIHIYRKLVAVFFILAFSICISVALISYFVSFSSSLAILLIIGVSVLFSFLFTGIFALFFIRHIESVRSAIIKSSSSGFKNKVDVNKNNIFSFLAENFNIIADDASKYAADFEERKRVFEKRLDEAALAKENYEYEHAFVATIFNMKNVLALMLDENNVVIHANVIACSMLNPVYTEIIGRRIEDVVPPEHCHLILDTIKEARRNIIPPSVLIKNTYEGYERYIDWCVVPISENNSECEYIACMGVDVTQGYTVLDTARENGIFFHNVFNNLLNGALITDSEGAIVIWNNAVASMFNYSNEEINGRQISPLIIPEEYTKELIKTGGSPIEIYAIKKNGEIFPVEVTLVSVQNKNHLRNFYYIKDITERKKREIELYRTLDKAEMAEKAKTEFLANMSHEIRTPLNGIIGFLNLLKQTSLSETQLEYLNIVNMSADGLLSIMNKILDFAKIESGRMSLENTEFDAYSEFEDAAEQYAAQADEKGLDFNVSIDTDMPQFIIGDPLRIRQILSNLLSNAVKYTDNGGIINFSISVLETDSNSCRLKFSVSDTGIGIRAEDQDIIFDSFSQTDGSVTRRYGGSGLGLAICSKLAAMIGDGLKCVSEEGKGSEFYFIAAFPVGNVESIARPNFSDLHVAILSAPEFKSLDHIAGYFDAFSCSWFYFKSVSQLREYSPSVIFICKENIDIDLIKEICEAAPSSLKILLIRKKDRDKIISLVSDKNIITIYRPVNFSKIQNALTTYLNKASSVESVDSKPITYSARALIAENNSVDGKLVEITLNNFGLNVDSCHDGSVALEMAQQNKYDMIFIDINLPCLDAISLVKKIRMYETENGLTHSPIICLVSNISDEDRKNCLASGIDDFIDTPLSSRHLTEILERYLNRNGKKEKTQYVDKHVHKAIGHAIGVDDNIIISNILDEWHHLTFGQLEAMIVAIMKNDMTACARIAHSVSVSAANLHFTRIARLADDAEKECLTGHNVRDIRLLVDDLKRELEQINKTIG